MLSSNWILQIKPENGALKIMGYGLTAYYIKREHFQQAKSIPELKQCGIYFLYGETENDGKFLRNIYVGQAVVRQNGEGVWWRIREHSGKKFWTEAIACVSANDSWGPSELSYLENYFANLLFYAKKDSKSYMIHNDVTPNPGNPTVLIKTNCSNYIEEITTILETLRYDFFKEEKLEQPLLNLSTQSLESVGNSTKRVISEQTVAGFSFDEKSAAKKDRSAPAGPALSSLKQKKHKAPPSVLVVSFPDGTVIHREKAAETLAMTINRIGPKKVADLFIHADGGYLVSREGSLTYPESNYPLDDGFVLITHSSTDVKMDKLKKISKKLNLGLIINKTPKND